MRKKKILFICGSINQTTMMHKISGYFENEELRFTPFYGSGYIDFLAKTGILDFSVLGGQFMKNTLAYIKDHNLPMDFKGKENDYDLVFTCADLVVPANIRDKRVILVQEGMTDPENFIYHLVKTFKLPRYLASTSTMGLSDAYDRFCVASEGYKEHFVKKGVNPDKIVVTGIPNFDDCARFLKNDFPHKNFVLVATSDARETFKYENRKAFIREAVKIAAGRQLIFKLHPNELWDRAYREIKELAPDALVYQKESINPMIANCDVLITIYSTVVYIGMALGKEVYSRFDINDLRKMTPIQNGGISAENIAKVGRELIETDMADLRKENVFSLREAFRPFFMKKKPGFRY